jgi:hypothetical protein
VAVSVIAWLIEITSVAAMNGGYAVVRNNHGKQKGEGQMFLQYRTRIDGIVQKVRTF